MAISQREPNTILLGGGMNAADGAATYINDLVAVETLTPGMILELHDDNGVPAWGVHDTADDPVEPVVALEKGLFLNKGVDDTYADGELVIAAALKPGSMFWGIVPSGQDINVGARLQSNGDGKLKAAATGHVKFVSHTDTGGAVTEDTRVKVEVLT